jgi:hypothetical protein
MKIDRLHVKTRRVVQERAVSEKNVGDRSANSIDTSVLEAMMLVDTSVRATLTYRPAVTPKDSHGSESKYGTICLGAFVALMLFTSVRKAKSICQNAPFVLFHHI